MWLVLLFSFCLPLVSSAVIGNIESNSKECFITCEKTYPLHTYPFNEDLVSCQKGCQLSAVVHFFDDGQNSSASQNLCGSACLKVYNTSSQIYACQVGCSSQDAIVVEEEIEDNKSEHKNETSFDLVFYVQSVFERMTGFFSSTWVLYIADEESGQNSIVASENIVATSSMLHKDSIPGGWYPKQNEEGKRWLQKDGTSVTCFYDFLHFLFFKIIMLFLIFLFILTVLTLMRITMFDMNKKREYVSFIESPNHLDTIPLTTKLDV